MGKEGDLEVTGILIGGVLEGVLKRRRREDDYLGES